MSLSQFLTMMLIRMGHLRSNSTGTTNSTSRKALKNMLTGKLFEKTTSFLSSSRQLFIMKHSARISATGQNMVRRKERDTEECPRCGARDEDNKHIMTCKDKQAESIF